MFYRRLPRGLYVKVLSGLVAVILVVLTGTTMLSVRSSQTQLMDELVEQGRSQAEILAYSASEYLAQQNQLQLTLIAKNAVARRNLQYIAFYSSTSDLLAAASTEDSRRDVSAPFTDLLLQGDTATRWSNDYLEIAQPVLYAQRSIGTVALRISTEGLAADQQRTLRQGVFTGLILAFVLSGALGILLRYLVLAPLRQLTSTAEVISAGSWIVPPGRERNDELGQVARSFGHMVEILQTRERQLQEQIAAVKTLNAELDGRVAQRTSDLNELVTKQEHLLAQIHQMSTPVVPVMKGVIVVPIVGSLDSQRAARLVESVLSGIEQHQVRDVVLDITGVPVVDTHVAGVLLQIADAARLLGARTSLVGIRPEVAQTLVQLGVDLSRIHAFPTLQEALRLRDAYAQSFKNLR